jgi:hypothetical protein
MANPIEVWAGSITYLSAPKAPLKKNRIPNTVRIMLFLFMATSFNKSYF